MCTVTVWSTGAMVLCGQINWTEQMSYLFNEAGVTGSMKVAVPNLIYLQTLCVTLNSSFAGNLPIVNRWAFCRGHGFTCGHATSFWQLRNALSVTNVSNNTCHMHDSRLHTCLQPRQHTLIQAIARQHKITILNFMKLSFHSQLTFTPITSLLTPSAPNPQCTFPNDPSLNSALRFDARDLVIWLFGVLSPVNH